MRNRQRRRRGLVRDGDKHVESLLLHGHDYRPLAVHQSVRDQFAHDQSDVIYQVGQIVTRQMRASEVSRVTNTRVIWGKDKNLEPFDGLIHHLYPRFG